VRLLDSLAVEYEPGIVSHLKNPSSIALRGGEKAGGTSPNPATYCHLLPFVAAKPSSSLQSVACISCPFEGVAASLGLGLRTVSGAVRSLGEKRSPRASLSHDRRIRQLSDNDIKQR
jgi:hypothetical protein